MNHLNTLLREASTDAPPDHVDVAVLVSTGRSRVRRRRAAAGVAVAAVAGLALGVSLVATDGDSPDQSPAASPVELTLDDAVPAEPGLDYQVLRVFTAHSTDDTMSGDFVQGVLPDGTVVVTRYPNGQGAPSEIALVGPGGTRVATAPAPVINYRGATERELVFGSTNGGLWVLDLAGLEWRHILTGSRVTPNLTQQPLSAIGGHIFVPGDELSQETVRPIYDVDLATGDATELAQGGDVATHGGRVAWTNAYDAPVRTVTVRDQAGATTTFDPGTGDCSGIGLGITAERIVVMTNCDDEAGDTEYTDVVTRIDVFDLDGQPVARITGDDDMGPVRMSDRYVTLANWAEGAEGTYTYDLETGQFLRVTNSMSGLAGSETGVGATVVWEKRLDGDTGATYVIAQMR